MHVRVEGLKADNVFSDVKIDGWSLLGSNGHACADRLAELGWTAQWSKEESLRRVLEPMLEIGV